MLKLKKTYQIKSRWHRKILKTQFNRSGTYEFGSVKKNEDGKFSFDYLILVLFNDSLTDNYKVYEIESKNIEKMAKENIFITKNEKYIFRWSEDKIKDKRIKDITKKVETK